MELNRLARIVKHRWAVVVLASAIGFAAAFGFTASANADVETVFETVISIRFDPDEGETVQDLADEVEDAHALAVFAAEDIISEHPNASVSFDIATGRLFFTAEASNSDESVEVAQAMVRAYLERDPVAGGDIAEQLAGLVETATVIEAQMQLITVLTAEETALVDQHDLLDRRISTVEDRIVALTVADVGATPEEQATNEALRVEAQLILARLLAEKAALPPRPSGELSAQERLELRGLQRQLDYLAIEYERLFLRTQGVAARGGRVEAVTTTDLSPQPANPLVNGAVGFFGGIGIALMSLVFLSRARNELWLGEDLPVPLLGEVPGRKVAALAGPAWYDTAQSGSRKDAIQVVRTAIEGSLDHTPTALAVLGDHVDPTGRHALAVDLGAAFASAGKGVLLVDADFSESIELAEYLVGEPTLASVLELPPSVGETLRPRVADFLGQAVYIRPNLAVIPAGPAPTSPADALAGPQLRVLLDEASNRFDLVILIAGEARSPAGQVLSQRAGNALLAVGPGRSTISGVRSLVADMAQQKVRMLGAVSLHGKETIFRLPSRPFRVRRRVSPSDQLPASPVTHLGLYPFPGSKGSGLLDGGSLRDLAEGLVRQITAEGDSNGGGEDTQRDDLGTRILRALRQSDPETVYEPVAEYLVTRVEDVMTAEPGQDNISTALMNVILDYGFVPIRRVRGHRSIGDWLIDELRSELGDDHGEEIATELVRIVGEGDGEPATALDTWISEEFFDRHLERTQREPAVWHLTSEGGSVQVLATGSRMTRERLTGLTVDVIRGTIDDLQRRLKEAERANDGDAVAAVEHRLSEVREFEIAVGMLEVEFGVDDDERHGSLLGRRRGERAPGLNLNSAESRRSTIALLQRLGLLPSPVLTEEELLSLQVAG